MARDISELGADVYDDTVVAKKGKLSPKKKNYIIGLSCTAVGVLGLIFVYIMMAKVWFIDLENIEYLTFSYPVDPENGERTVCIDSIDLDSNYPENFRIPHKVSGMKVTKIGNGAFKGADRLKSVDLSKIESIGEEAFSGCEKLESFTFNRGLKEIGSAAFLNTKYYNAFTSTDMINVYDILIYAGADYFQPNTVVLADHDSVVPEKYKGSTYNIKYYSDFFDTEVGVWPAGAFLENENLVYFEIPSYVSNVPNSLFEGCINLEGADYSQTKVESISKKSMYKCTKLSEIKLPDTVKHIGESAFFNTKINSPVGLDTAESIDDAAYRNCKNIETVVYPEQLTYVPQYLFYGCSKLANFSFANPDKITTISAGAFKNTALTSFRFPKYVETVNDEVLAECEKLEYVELYENTTDAIFEGSDQLEEGVETIPTFVSYDGSTVKNGKPIGVSRINGSAFANSLKFKSIKLYDESGALIDGKSADGEVNFPITLTNTNSSTISATGVGDFVGTKIEKVKINPSTKNIAEECFDGVTSLTSVEFGKYSNGKCDLSAIYKYAFRKTNITSIEIPNSVTKIGLSAFANCHNLETVVLPENGAVSFAIENGTFRGCEKLSSINLPSNLTKISTGAFESVKGISRFDIPLTCITLDQDSFIDMCEEGGTRVQVYLPWTEDEVKQGAYINGNGDKIQLFVSLDEEGNVNFCDDTVEVIYKVA